MDPPRGDGSPVRGSLDATQQNEETRARPGWRLRMPNLNPFARRPSLQPEVVELSIPTASDQATSSSPEPGASFTDIDLNPRSEDQNSLVFDTHIAVLYDKYLNFKEALSNKIRDKIMAFMRDDLENQPEDETDLEGGLSDRYSHSTYDGLILILTIVLGFAFKCPFMWIVGSFLFIIYGNFKRKIIKWGVINILLSIVSIVYAAQIWDFTDPELFYIKAGKRSILLSVHKHIGSQPGVLKQGDRDFMVLEFRGDKSLKWTTVSLESKDDSKTGNFSDDLLVNGKLVPESVDIIRLEQEIVLRGLLQVSVKFRTMNLTLPERFERPKSHHYPLHHQPAAHPHDVSFQCVPLESSDLHDVEHEVLGSYFHINLGEDHVDRSNRKNLKGRTGDPTDMPAGEIHVSGPGGEGQSASEAESPESLEDEDEDGVARYIGVDAVESDVLVTRLYYVKMLSKCQLIHLPRPGLDVVEARLKRLQ